MPSIARRVLAVLLMLIGVTAAVGSGELVERRTSPTSHDALGAATRSDAPADAVTPPDVGRVVDAGTPGRARQRWLSTLAATMVLALAATIGSGRRLPARRRRAVPISTPMRAASGRAPPAFA